MSSLPAEESSGVDDGEIDFSLSDVDKIRKYAHSEFVNQRMEIARELVQMSKVIERTEIINYIMPSITTFSNDTEHLIRLGISDHLPYFTSYFLKGGEEQISRVLIPSLDRLLSDDNPQVRERTIENFIKIAKTLDSDKQRTLLIPILSKLSSSRDEEHRVIVADLIGKLGSIMEKEIFREFAIEEIKKLAKDRMFRVRKSAAVSIGLLSSICDPSISTSLLLPVFINLTKDNIWGVKKACTESIVPLASSVDLSARRNELSSLFLLFLNDSSRWVRNAAYQNLGQFISTLQWGDDDQSSSSKLFRSYCSILDPLNKPADKFDENDTALYCAYSFPGVLFSIGKLNWLPLQPLYSSLSRNSQIRVRKTLASSIHEVASILGRELTEEHLLSIFNGLLKDKEEVQSAILRHFAKFLAILSPSNRSTYLPLLFSIITSNCNNNGDNCKIFTPNNWRFRHLISLQMGEIIKLYDDDYVQKEIILPIVYHLCSDPVATVRQSIASQMGTIFNNLNRSIRDEFIDEINNFSNAENCFSRQFYAICCESLASEIEAQCFIDHFYLRISKLSEDQVPNIRMIISRLFNQNLNSEKYLVLRNQILPIIEKFATDTDREVRFYGSTARQL